LPNLAVHWIKASALRAAAPAAHAPGMLPCGADPALHGRPGNHRDLETIHIVRGKTPT
jgi:hypothetical protein